MDLTRPTRLLPIIVSGALATLLVIAAALAAAIFTIGLALMRVGLPIGGGAVSRLRHLGRLRTAPQPRW